MIAGDFFASDMENVPFQCEGCGPNVALVTRDLQFANWALILSG